MRDIEWYRHRTRTLADDDIDSEVLHSHIEHLFGRPGHPVDLVKEENLTLRERREDCGQVAGMLNGRTTGDPDRGTELMGNDQGDGGLAQAGGTREEDVVGSVTAAQCGLQHEAELFTNALLADELVQPPGPQRRFDDLVIAARVSRDQPLPLVNAIWVPRYPLGLCRVRDGRVASVRLWRLACGGVACGGGGWRCGSSPALTLACATRIPRPSIAGHRRLPSARNASFSRAGMSGCSPAARAASASGATAPRASSASRADQPRPTSAP